MKPKRPDRKKRIRPGQRAPRAEDPVKIVPIGRPLLTEQDLERLTGHKAQSFRNARCSGVGDLATLPWLKIGRSIRYSPDAVERWLAEREHKHQRLAS